MIVGNGLLANAFRPNFEDEPSVLIYAAGVSDSTCQDSNSFDRERYLLETTLAESTARRRVYFSSCALADPHSHMTPYLLHKQRMEMLVIEAGGLVLRLPQVVGRTGNPKTLTNFIYDCIVHGRRFTVWKTAQRNLIDIDDVAAIGTRIILAPPEAPSAISIAAPHSTPMLLIVEAFERVLGIKGNYQLDDRGDPLELDTELAQKVAGQLEIDMGPGYLESVIRKYYGPE
ncbi:NAD-dependent epimerase/dehydratase family protein [Lysobacter sp. S4-A87]|uniref:NAD-dependent epimerase/dehydratase family protein n=1 Tax=Lysobacter sp. S4-A87 TaxID=2925843 RepID=UPI001F52D51D|nr:NAD-dependent epimerase/dehydratase family protein [Lysobacter sp. S4-A87]UNK48890.1 NAD-dependent epimerase/dehydratase family protein [Lysobacter sp. S4-A87]